MVMQEPEFPIDIVYINSGYMGAVTNKFNPPPFYRHFLISHSLKHANLKWA